jgi:hypothetical protein
MLSAFTLKIHIKSPSKIQTRSQTCKQFTKRVAVTITEYRYIGDVKKRLGNKSDPSPSLLASSSSFPVWNWNY